MAVLETLEDLRELNAANFNGVDPKMLLEAEEEYKKQLEWLEKQEDEEEVKRIFAQKYSQFEETEISNAQTSRQSNKLKLEDTKVNQNVIKIIILKLV